MKKTTFLFLITLFLQQQQASGVRTELMMRAQDDATLGGLKVKIVIPEALEDGPRNAFMEVVTDPQRIAKLDNEGNFMSYEVDSAGNIVPTLILEARGITSPTDQWADAKARVIIRRGREDRLAVLPVQAAGDRFYLAINSEVFSQDFFSDIQKQNSNPLSLRMEDRVRRPFVKKSIEQMPFFDAVSVFGNVWSVLDMYTKDLSEHPTGSARLARRGRLRIFPHMTVEQYQRLYPGANYSEQLSNAFYDYRSYDTLTESQHVLCFFPLREGSPIYTSQSADIVFHEAGHYALNLLRPDLWGGEEWSEARAFHETFGDMTALFSVLHNEDLRRETLKATKGNLHVRSFLSIIGEDIVDRDASTCTPLYIRPSCEEHALSERLTRALYGTLADFINIQKTRSDSSQRDPLERPTQDFRLLFLRATLDSSNPTTFLDFGRIMRINAAGSLNEFIHINFLRQGIDLTGIPDGERFCDIPSKNKKTNPHTKCTTGRIRGLRGQGSAAYPVFYQESIQRLLAYPPVQPAAQDIFSFSPLSDDSGRYSRSTTSTLSRETRSPMPYPNVSNVVNRANNAFFN